MKYSQTFKTKQFMTHVQKETAQLLKEKGFDLPCRQFYDGNVGMGSQENNPVNWNKYDDVYSSPTLHEATDWLRETKGVHVQVGTYHYNVGVYYWESTVVEIEDGKYHQVGMFDTHDLALEAGIVHALKHYVK